MVLKDSHSSEETNHLSFSRTAMQSDPVHQEGQGEHAGHVPWMRSHGNPPRGNDMAVLIAEESSRKQITERKHRKGHFR